MDLIEQRAAMFKALGDKTRVQIFDFLRERCCPIAVEEGGEVRPLEGPSVGEVCCHVTGKEKITSTVSFHINELKDAGLISVERRGKYMICDVDRAAVARLAAYLGEEGVTKKRMLAADLGPRQMIKRYIAEFLGTFVVVVAPVAFSATSHRPGGDGTLLSAALISGLAVLAMIYALGPISAAHFNPAVTLGFAVAGRFPWKYTVPYWIAQFLGGIAAAGVVAFLLGPGFGAHIPTDPSLIFRNVGIEALITFLLMLVIIAVATDRRVSGAVPAVAIGLTVVIGVMIGGPVTGGSMNPARSFGPALFAGQPALSAYWLYLISPAIGASLAALLYEAIRIDKKHACGAPNELLEVLEEIGP